MRTSTQEVLPPYRMFSICGVGVEPRTPQNFTYMRSPTTRYTDLAAHVAQDLAALSLRVRRQPQRKESVSLLGYRNKCGCASECVTVLYLNAMGTESRKSSWANTDGYL